MKDTDKLEALGRYRLVRRIGRGGMGEVWLAEDPHLLRQVALKVLPLRKRDDEEFLMRFEREAHAAAALHHPHILPVHDYGQQQMPDNQAITYLVMSYVSGGSVDDRLKALSNGQGVLTQDEALTYLFQVAEAIDYAHVHNIVHRDIKPANMLLRDDNWLLLTDFGIARILTDADAFATGTYLGTPTYMAPEQAQGHAVPASDIYSLAVVAYQLFTGRVPFQADNPLALSFQHAFAAPTSPRVYNPDLSPEFEAALLRGLEKDPAQRPRSASAYVTGLDQALKSFPSHQPTPVQSLVSSVTPRPPQHATRRKVLQGAGIGAGTLLVGGGIAAYLAQSLLHHSPRPVKSPPVASPTMNSASGAPLAITAAFTKPAGSMVWSPTRNVLAISSQDAQIALWDFTSASQSSPPQQLGRLNKGTSLTSLLASWSPDGKMLVGITNALASKNGFYLWNSNNRTQPRFFARPQRDRFLTFAEIVDTLAWCPTNPHLLLVSDADQALIWDVRKDQPLLTLSATVDKSIPEISKLSWSPNGRYVAASYDPVGDNTKISVRPQIFVWDIQALLKQASAGVSQSPALTFSSPTGSPTHTQGIIDLNWSLDGRYLATSSFDKSVLIWKVNGP